MAGGDGSVAGAQAAHDLVGQRGGDLLGCHLSSPLSEHRVLVALGVALVLAVSITNASAKQSFESFFAQASGHANLTVADAASMTVQKGMRASLLREVKDTPSVINAVGMTSDSALLTGKDNTVVNLTVLGIDPIDDVQVRTYELAQGRFLTGQDRSYDIVLPKPLAEKRGIALNDKIDLFIREQRSALN